MIDLFFDWLAATVAVGSPVVAALILRRRRLLLASDLHEVRQALTATRLMIDVMPSADAASDELARASRSLIDFERHLHASSVSFVRGREQESESEIARPAFDVRAEIDRLMTIWTCAAAASGRKLALRWEAGDAAIAGERRRLTEAVANLLSNAIRHGEGDITLTVRERDEQLRIEIADEGRGLSRPISEIASIRRGMIRRSAAHGHGIAVAMRAARLLDGELIAAPASGGAVLVLQVPLARPAVGVAAVGAGGIQ